MTAVAGTPPPVSGTSTPGFGDFMTGLTPGGFFSASYHLDNPFEKSFGEQNQTMDTTAEPFSKGLQAPTESNSIYGFPSSSSFFNSPYPTKMEITPPATATDAPVDWQFGDSLPAPQMSHMLVNNVSPDISNSHAKIQYGQATPPDEQSLREPGLDEVNSALVHQQRPSTSKRESSASNKSTKSSKRSKKSPRVSLAAEGDSAENSEEVEKRSKFLERNRVAASKCRQKKKEHNAALEQRAKNLERENALLKMTMESLQAEKISLMTQMAMHTPDNCDCREIHQHLAHFKAKYNVGIGPDDMGPQDVASPSASTIHDRTNSVVSASPVMDQELRD